MSAGEPNSIPTLVFVDPQGNRRQVAAPIGHSVLEIAHRHNIDIEGACEGAMACSTCHVVVADQWYHRLPDPSEDEEDMLDLAFGLTRTSRLGCQLVMTADLDGLEVHLPDAVHNMML